VKDKAEVAWTDAPVGQDELTVGETAKRLGVTRPAILYAIWTGRLPAVRRHNPLTPQGVYYLKVADVEAHVVRPPRPRSKARPAPKRTPRRNHNGHRAS
jgi:hypothetical protein